MIEPAVLSAEIEQLADFHGYLKLASRPEWWRVRMRHDNAQTETLSAMAGRLKAGTRGVPSRRCAGVAVASR